MARGRPLGTKNQRKKTDVTADKLPPITPTCKLTCVHCGCEKIETQFYLNKWTSMWASRGGRVQVCKNCIQDFHKTWQSKYGDLIAANIVCHYMDFGFTQEQYNAATSGGEFNIGEYVRAQNLNQQKYLTYADTIAKNEVANDDTSSKQDQKWSRQDKKNREYVISVVGYDPWQNTVMSDSDLIFSYNVLSGYCDNEGVSEDGHKIQCIIQITNSLLQVRKIDEMLAAEQGLGAPADAETVGKLSRTKQSLLTSINKLAQDNNISSNFNKRSHAGKHTLAQKMKDMQNDDYWPAKQNMFDVKTSEAMKQIADLSHKSILDQLQLDDNDYVQMIKEQREKIVKLDAELMEANELNRNLNNRIADLTAANAKRKKGGEA